MTATINWLAWDRYSCFKCKESFLISIDDPEKHLMKSSMRCPNYRTCQGRIRKKDWTPMDSIRPFKYRTLKALDLFQASAGVGLPEERKCSPTEVRRMMVGARISEVHLEKAPDIKKSILMSMTLDNGKVLHITTSTKGAVVYEVTEVSNGR